MEKMKYKEFQNRMSEVAKARKIFIPHITKNISIAFELYQKVLAEEKMEVFISTLEGGNKPMTPFDDYERPTCDECGKELGLKINAKDEAGINHPTAWVCECGIEYYSDKTVREWMEELSEAGKQNDKAKD